MTDSLPTSLSPAPKTTKRIWLYGPEPETSPVVAGQGWNEGYLPTSKFLYFTEATHTAPESKTRKTLNREEN